MQVPGCNDDAVSVLTQLIPICMWSLMPAAIAPGVDLPSHMHLPMTVFFSTLSVLVLLVAPLRWAQWREMPPASTVPPGMHRLNPHSVFGRISQARKAAGLLWVPLGSPDLCTRPKRSRCRPRHLGPTMARLGPSRRPILASSFQPSERPTAQVVAFIRLGGALPAYDCARRWRRPRLHYDLHTDSVRQGSVRAQAR